MRIFLLLLCFLRAAQVLGIFDGACNRKDPPPGVLVVSPGSKLVLTCKGHVLVNGVTVNIARNTNRIRSTSVAPPTTGHNLNNKHTMDSNASEVYNSNSEVTTVTGENRSPRYTDAGSTASPTTHMVEPTSVSRVLKSDWEDEEINSQDDYEEDEEEKDDKSRITRGIKPTPQWSWNRKMVGRGKRDWGEIKFDRKGAMLSLASVRLMDSGNYTCHHKGRELFALKVIVADPPEDPSLSCYKKSPSSKIRCEWVPKKPIAKLPHCYLVWNKRPAQTFDRLQCSYSHRLSRYWCILEHNEDELRTLYTVYLCVTSISGNTTSPLLSFTPLSILKPDPPSGVNVQQVEGHERFMRVTWNSPVSWKSQDSYYNLIYELQYRPLEPSLNNEQYMSHQTKTSSSLSPDTITDLMPGVEYVIQVRTREEYDGQWSEWSTPVISKAWTAPAPSDLYTTMFPVEEGSSSLTEVPETDKPDEERMSHHILWISGSFLFLSVILAAYIMRHKDRFMPKLHHLSVITQCSDSSQPPPSSPTAPEGQALVTFPPPHYKEAQQNRAEEGEDKNEEEQSVKERIEAIHFHNTSYFLLRRE